MTLVEGCGYVAATFIGAGSAILWRMWADEREKKAYRKSLAWVCVEHLTRIKKCLDEHTTVSDGKARASETWYSEASAGLFLYDVILLNLEKFGGGGSLKKTVEFFHHYKINMATVRGRLDVRYGDHSLTEGTFRNLQGVFGWRYR